jgi:hypothetical protein
MLINRLIRRKAVAPTRMEPVATGRDVPSGDRFRDCERVGNRIALGEYDFPGDYEEDTRGSHAVLGLIGTFVATGDGVSRLDAGGVASGADDLIETLHAQYCRVLDDPHASLADNWAAQTVPVGDLSAGANCEPSAGARAPHIGSIEALLSGSRFMEDVFGPLATSDAPDLAATEPVPEILRLFAPAEYLAAASRRPRALPPALARREHHSLGMDSPLPASDSTPHHDAQ